MSNHLVILTSFDTPRPFIVQKFSEGAIRKAIVTDPVLAESEVHIFSFKPYPHESLHNQFHGVPLTPVHLPVQNPFEHHLQVAMYYARVNGARPEHDELRRAGQLIVKRLKELEVQHALTPNVANSEED